MAQPYEALRQLMDKISAQVTPASLHGLWCGRIAGGDTAANGSWWIYSTQFMEAESFIEPAMSKAFEAVFDYAEAAMTNEAFTFSPWLPDDEVACELRVAALADWSRGFIEGLTSVQRDSLQKAGGEVQEILEDLMHIGEVDSDITGSEEDERQLWELTEFVKVAALNMLHEFSQSPATSEPKPESLH